MKRATLILVISIARPWALVQNGQAVGPTVTSGVRSALDTATGTMLWQTPDPAGGQTQDPGAVTAANGRSARARRIRSGTWMR